MKLDTKEESFEHLVTVLSIFFGDAREETMSLTDKSSSKEWEKKHQKERRLYNEAEKYLKSFMIELIKQKYD